MEPQPIVPQPVGQEAKNWAVVAHLAALVNIVGIPSVIGPLVVWLLKKDEDPFIDYHGKEALNFNISFLIYGIVSGLLILVAIGLVLLPVVLITWLVLVIIGAVRTSNGEYYRYPLTIRLVN
ncbi:hypothetical protein BMS3Abin02_01966 [bacterium BMS3Abin02]|nr:hypothetical protein BMS3Abin02_01966 [bacterium BMS3Abin02]GBE21172.1 hypothetical protein BMS3Bbin01_00513 [bacterium BMS3Bbin01]HDH25026.1 DUF4870 domain-containing protein [Actinomycetota bacterium]HDK45666.1 DUF4870 domain-containing protein [Actinomycetota bacterium]HDL49371.1 DUF4870 domain-containing protein [Actinomycetota bacterium]